MKKKVLVVYYTQTGQQKEILDRMLHPLDQDQSVELTFHEIKPVEDYPFPWDDDTFFDAFPESFLQIPCPLNPVPASIMEQEYDMVILGYQVWYLTPSIPVNSFLKSKEAEILLNNKPVITVIGCRNMWAMAQEKVKKQLLELDARLVGNIALVDKNVNHISLITIVHWMMKGKKDSYMGIFPKPGVSDKDIWRSARFGEVILEHLRTQNYHGLQDKLLAKGAVMIRPLLVFIDRRGNTMFSKWSKLIRSKGLPGEKKRKLYLKLFYGYLFVALWFIAPIVSLLYFLFYLPFFFRIKKETAYLKSVNFK